MADATPVEPWCSTCNALRKQLHASEKVGVELVGQLREAQDHANALHGFHADVLKLLGVNSSVQATDKIRRLTDALWEAKPALLRVASQLAQMQYGMTYTTQASKDATTLRALVEMGESDE